MIRRATTTVDGQAAWVLISQIEHAQLAAALAKPWGATPFVPLGFREELLAAIHHHDDGWADWDRQPPIDDAGQPIDFTEMRLSDALSIWTSSIDGARRLGPLAPFVVSGHFCALLEASTARRRSAAAMQWANAFLDQQRRQQAEWLAAWRALDPVTHTPEAAEQAVRWLQFFDRFSLWLSCAPRSKSEALDPPGTATLLLSPQDVCTIGVSPWPWQLPELLIAMSGRQVATGCYESAEALAAANSQQVTLRWRLTPA